MPLRVLPILALPLAASEAASSRWVGDQVGLAADGQTLRHVHTQLHERIDFFFEDDGIDDPCPSPRSTCRDGKLRLESCATRVYAIEVKVCPHWARLETCNHVVPGVSTSTILPLPSSPHWRPSRHQLSCVAGLAQAIWPGEVSLFRA